MQTVDKTHKKRSVLFWLFYLLWIFIFSCNDGASSIPSNTGEMCFEIDYSPIAPYHAATASRTPQALDCAASGVYKIEAILYDKDDGEHKQGGPWNCDTGGGTIEGIPPADNLKIVILGRNADGLLIFRGEKQGIHVRPGERTEAGTVDALPVQPVLSIVPDEPNCLAWNNDAGAFYFNVLISENDQFDPLTVNATTTQGRFVPSDLTTGQTYHARVIPWIYPNMEGLGSQPLSFTPMTPPTLLSPQDGILQSVVDPLNFQWNGSTGADAYRIVVSAASDMSEPLIDEIVPDTTYNAPNIFLSTTYYWRVFARDIHGNEGVRSSVHSMVLGKAPNVPTDVSTASGNHTATIRWSGQANASSYTVYWSTTAGVSKTLYEGRFQDLTGTEYTQTNCTNKIPYYYIVTATNGFGESASTPEATCVPTPEWRITPGTAASDIGNGITVDQDGNIYVIGNTRASLHGEPNSGGQDVAILKYDTNGNRIQTILMGTPNEDQGNAIAVDQDGSIFVTGHLSTSPDLTEQGSFVTKYTPEGIKLWQERYTSPIEWVMGLAIAVDPNGNSYATGFIGGSEHMALLQKYDTNGVTQFAKYTSSGSMYGCEGHGIAVDNQGDFYITGWVSSMDTGQDVLVARYDTDGEEKSIRFQATDEEDVGKAIAVDPDGNYYITGYTYGDLGYNNTNHGECDIFVMKYNPYNIEIWTRLLGTPASDQGHGITVDNHGNSYVTGYTCGDLDGNPTSGGSCDVFIAKYDTNGKKLWVEVMGGDEIDSGRAIALDEEGNVVVTGEYAQDILIWKF